MYIQCLVLLQLNWNLVSCFGQMYGILNHMDCVIRFQATNNPQSHIRKSLYISWTLLCQHFLNKHDLHLLQLALSCFYLNSQTPHHDMLKMIETRNQNHRCWISHWVLGTKDSFNMIYSYLHARWSKNWNHHNELWSQWNFQRVIKLLWT
jgi:hypothetical protein